MAASFLEFVKGTLKISEGGERFPNMKLVTFIIYSHSLTTSRRLTGYIRLIYERVLYICMYMYIHVHLNDLMIYYKDIVYNLHVSNLPQQ